MAGSTWSRELAAAAAAARGGAEALKGRLGRATASLKGPNDLVTDADFAVQEAIRTSLLRRFPSDEFHGEEDPASEASPARTRRWIVDPIDGTANFVHGFPFYCISIALEAEGELVVGVVLDPTRGELFSAARGQGALCNAAPLRVSGNGKLSESLVNVGLPAVPEDHPQSIQTMVRLCCRARAVRRMGSAALALAYVAAGRMDAFVSDVNRPWDVAAGVVLIREAGGRATNFHIGRYNHYRPDILATNGLLHDEIDAEIAGSP